MEGSLFHPGRRHLGRVYVVSLGEAISCTLLTLVILQSPSSFFLVTSFEIYITELKHTPKGWGLGAWRSIFVGIKA